MVMGNYFPETTIRREGELLVCEIEETSLHEILGA